MGLLRDLKKAGITAAQIKAAVMRKFTGPGVLDTGAAVVISAPPQPRQPVNAVVVKVTGNHTGGGIYVGRIFTDRESVATTNANLVEGNFGDLPGEDDCYIYNGAEVDQPTHDLTTGTPVSKIFPGVVLRMADDGKKIVAINGYDVKTCTA